MHRGGVVGWGKFKLYPLFEIKIVPFSEDEELLNSSGMYYEDFRMKTGWNAGYDFTRLAKFTIPKGKEIGKL